MSWLSTLLNGDPTVNNAGNSLLKTGATTTGQGLGDINSATNFWTGILNGGGAKVLAPQINAIQGQGQQQKQTLSQFGNRSGGTNATSQRIGDKTKGGINDLIASLTGSAADNLGKLGTSLLDTGVNTTGAGATLLSNNKSQAGILADSAASGAASALTKWALA